MTGQQEIWGSWHSVNHGQEDKISEGSFRGKSLNSRKVIYDIERIDSAKSSVRWRQNMWWLKNR